jgi:hypothetical protein
MTVDRDRDRSEPTREMEGVLMRRKGLEWRSKKYAPVQNVSVGNWYMDAEEARWQPRAHASQDACNEPNKTGRCARRHVPAGAEIRDQPEAVVREGRLHSRDYDATVLGSGRLTWFRV